MPGDPNGLAQVQSPGLTSILELKMMAQILVVEALVALILDRRRDRQKTKADNQNGEHFSSTSES